MHETALIATIAAGLGLAFIFGLIATRLHLPPILGYLLAGVAAGPFTPGFVADAEIAAQLAEIGVMLLMFGVGLHFSVRDLLEVRKIAVPGAIAQITAATALGALVSHFWGWSWGTGLVFGLSLSVASTVVLLRALEDRGILESADGRIAVGWLIVEDLVTVVALVVLPVLAGSLGVIPPEAVAEAAELGAPVGSGGLWRVLGVTFIKLTLFLVLMLVVGRRFIPFLLGRVVGTGSRELFTLAVLAIAFGIAVGAAALFDVSFALGAFFAGVIVSESDFSHEAATNALPLQDAFAVLFFVSVGMLFDPAILIERPLQVLAIVAIIMVGKTAASLAIVLLFRYPLRTALVISASLAQIGEFSFILATLGVSLGLLPEAAQSLIVAGALLSISLNPFAFASIPRLEAWLQRPFGRSSIADALEREAGELAELPATVTKAGLKDHVVLIGYGRVGGPVARELMRHHIPFLVVEQSRERVEHLRKQGLPVSYGDASRPEVLSNAQLADARMVVVAAPDAYQARAIVALVRKVNPAVRIIVRTHSDEEREFLEANGADVALVGERELAISLTRHALRSYHIDHDMAAVAERTLRRPTRQSADT